MTEKETLIHHAKDLRKNSTNAENYIWQFLRNRHLKNYKFKRQYIIEPYIVDFVCIKKKLIIELDGGQHDNNIYQSPMKMRNLLH